jgi:hypothetical protein
MRFTVAWANVISENLALKSALACLTLVLIALSFVVLKLSVRKPLVVERACYSRVLATVDSERTPAEIETFVREALATRFDTNIQTKPGFLSQDEEMFRVQEQQDLKKRDISQRILVNSVTTSGEKVAVDSDRLFTVGTVRSALPFPLVLTLGTIARSEWNPYGLTIIQVSAPVSDAKLNGSKK